MIDKLLDILDLKKYENIRKIPKNTFYKEDDFNRINEKMFTSFIDTIYIITALNKNVINITDYKTEDYNYSEIYYIYVSLKELNKTDEIIKIIHSIIPNPCIVILWYNEKIILSTAKKRISKNDKTKQVIEDFFITEGIKLEYLSNEEKEFIEDIKLTKNSFENFMRFYVDISNKILIFNLQEIIWWYRKTHLENMDKLLYKYKEVKEFEREKSALEKEYKDEVAMWQQAALHSKMVELDEKLEQLKKTIKEI